MGHLNSIITLFFLKVVCHPITLLYLSISHLQRDYLHFKTFDSSKKWPGNCLYWRNHFKLQNLDTSNIGDTEKLERIVNQLGAIINQAWTKNAKKSKISKHSKQWWTEECSWSLNNYRMTRSLDNWKSFKKVVKNIKRSFFDVKIQEVANKSRGPWELMNWISRCKLPAIEAIKHNNRLCLSPESLWDALYSTFNTALNCQVDLNILSKIECKATSQ